MLVQGGGHPWQIWDHFACQEGGVVFGKEFYDEGVPKHFHIMCRNHNCHPQPQVMGIFRHSNLMYKLLQRLGNQRLVMRL
jgi:hypothetical protein